MRLSRKDYEFNNTRICQIMPKHVELDRVLINLYMLLKHNGRRLVTRTGRGDVTLDLISTYLNQHGDKLIGFSSYPDVVQDWVYSDLVDLVYRGRPDRESITAPLPLHLNAYKLRNPKHSSDYRGAEHIYSMIKDGEPDLIGRLAKFLGAGMEASNDTYDEVTPLDLQTLMIVRMVASPVLKENPSTPVPIDPPLCHGQSRLFADDLRRLLAYEGRIPRSVLISYIRTACGFHLGLYLLRLFHQLTGWVRDQQAHPICLTCPVDPKRDPHAFRACPYAFQRAPQAVVDHLPPLIIDMGDDHTSHMARLSRENCTRHFAAIGDYIQAVFTVNQVKRFAESDRGRRLLGSPPDAISDLVALLRDQRESLDNYFSERLDDILPDEERANEQDNVRAVYEMRELSALDRFIELVALDRGAYYRKYLTQQIDATLLKNQDAGLIRQGKGKRNERRWHIGSRLLEMLVQIAVLDPVEGGFRSRPILIDEFIGWLAERYGLVLMPAWAEATIEDYKAFNENVRRLKEKLREIGFYSDLSDAYNAQTIRPRYTIE